MLDSGLWRKYFYVYDVLNELLPYQQLQNDVLEVLQKYLPAGSSIIDIGCGTGNFSRKIKNAGYKVTAMDREGEAINIAQSKLSADNYLKLDVTDGFPTLNEQFEAVLLVNVLYSINPWLRSTVYEHIKKILKPNGLVIIVNPKKKFSSVKFAKQTIAVHYRRERIKILIRLARNLLSFCKLLFYNIRIEKERIHFFDPEDYLRIQKSGFKVIESRTVYFDQSMLYVYRLNDAT